MAHRKTLYEHFLPKNALNPRARRNNPTNLRIFSLAKEITLKDVVRAQASFDPFYPNISSIREISSFLAGKRVEKTNEVFSLKTSILTDRSEPVLQFTLANGHKLTYFTGNLSSVDILEHFIKFMKDYEAESSNKV